VQSEIQMISFEHKWLLVFGFFFGVMVVKPWNKLSRVVEKSPSLEIFHSQLDNLLGE